VLVEEMDACNEPTECIRKPEDGVAGEEEGALARTMGTGAFVFAFAGAASVCLCVCFSIGPRAARALLGMAAGEEGGVGRIRGICTQTLDTGGYDRLGRLFTGTACLEGAADGIAPFCIGMGPNGETDTVIGDGTCWGGFWLTACGRGRTVAEQAGGTEIRRGGSDEGVVCVRIRIGRGDRGTVTGGEDRRAQEVARRGGGQGSIGCGEGEGEGVDGGGGLESGRDDLDLTGEGQLLGDQYVEIMECRDDTLRAFESILPTSCLDRAPAPFMSSSFPRFFFLAPPPAAGSQQQSKKKDLGTHLQGSQSNQGPLGARNG
jgi:hypothetical protein